MSTVNQAQSTSAWQAYTAGTEPTVVNGTSSMTFADCAWRRVGDSIQVRGRISSAAADGNGSRFELSVIPTGLTVKSTGWFSDLQGTVGDGQYFKNGTGTFLLHWTARSSGSICPLSANTTASAFVASSILNGDGYSWNVTIPITGWGG